MAIFDAARFREAWSRILGPFAVIAYAVGVVWRVLHITRWHDPRDYIYSDMQMYVEVGQRLADPDYAARAFDVTHPPAMSIVIATFYNWDPTFEALVWTQALVSCLVPLSVAWLAYVAFDRVAAQAALGLSSLYFPFVDFGGYFLSEIYMMLVLPLGFALLWLGLSHPSRLRGALLGGAAGLCLFLAVSLKTVALPATICFAIAALWPRASPPDARRPIRSRRHRAIVLAAAIVAMLPGSVAMTERCTEANGGTVCFGSNKTGADFLLGHYGRIQGLTWKDPDSGVVMSFGSPSAYQHGYREIPTMPFGITDGEKNRAEAWRWIRDNKLNALLLSFEHVFDTLGATLPWPAVATKYWAAAQAAQYIFLVFVLLPVGTRLIDLLRRRGLMRTLESPEVLALSPVVGLLAAVFIATGEPRYRMPFDGLFLLVAIQFYREAFRARRRAPAPP